MIDKWCQYEIKSLEWDLNPLQSDFVHFMKYEYVVPNRFEMDKDILICEWDSMEHTILIEARPMRIIINRDDIIKPCQYQQVFEQMIKGFVPEIYRFI